MMSSELDFTSLGLHEALQRAVTDAGYDTPTTVQAQAIPPALEGRDLMVASSTGSGKTASFILPALQRVLAARGDASKRREKGMVFGPRVLVLAPTRELAMQVAKAADTYGRHVQGLRVATVVGGVPYPMQIKALRGPLDLLIATPGRLLDHLQTGKAVLENVETLVLDEADRMLDMGFIDDIRTIADHTPAARQTLMYSATFAGHAGRLAQELLRDAERIEVASHTETHAHIEQRLHWADDGRHKHALLEQILAERDLDQAVVFTSTQRDADDVADRLATIGHRVAALHGAMPQGRRNRTLGALRRGELRVLVATDVAARGIDVPSISHVINYGLPMKAEDYVHRIGRTGRAGRAGLAITLAERADVGMIRRIQHFTTQDIPVATITGLEPKQPAPRLFASRPEGRGDARHPGRHGRPNGSRWAGEAGGRAPHAGGPGRSPHDGQRHGAHAHHAPGWRREGPQGAAHDPRFARSQDRPAPGPGHDRGQGGAHAAHGSRGERPTSGFGARNGTSFDGRRDGDRRHAPAGPSRRAGPQGRR